MNAERIMDRLVKQKIRRIIDQKAEQAVIQGEILGQGVKVDSFRPENVKKTILNLLLDKKLDFKKLINDINKQTKTAENALLKKQKTNTADIDIKKALFLDYLLEKLNVSDTMLNAQQINDELNKDQASDMTKFDAHTDDLKENFYEIFQVFFGEKERMDSIHIKNHLFEYFMKMEVKELLKIKIK